MRILIVEDKRPTAEDIAKLLRQLYKGKTLSVHIETTLGNALYYVHEKPIDVLFLDLNLNSEDGFEILRQAVAQSFYTIVLSANTSRAIEAFEYGVLDFIPKPYTPERVKQALERLTSRERVFSGIKFLSVKKGHNVKLLPLSSIDYIKAVNVYSELHLTAGTIEVYDKSLKKIEHLLPDNFVRVHKSYIVRIDAVKSLWVGGGGKYYLVTNKDEKIPVSRAKIDILRKLFSYASPSSQE